MTDAEKETRRLRWWLAAIAESPEAFGHEMKADARRALDGEEFPDNHPMIHKISARDVVGG